VVVCGFFIRGCGGTYVVRNEDVRNSRYYEVSIGFPYMR
jgi:hypothetical protein